MLETCATRDAGRAPGGKLKTAEQLAQAGFEVYFHGEDQQEGAVSPQEDEVDVDIFRRWLEVGTMQLGRVVGRWWAEAPAESEAEPEALKI